MLPNGTFRHNVDSKGRVAVPAIFRRALGGGAVIARTPAGRLAIRPREAWERYLKSVQPDGDADSEPSEYLRVLCSSARDVDLDGQGRILLDSGQRRYARIGGEAVFLSLPPLDMIEVHGPELWDPDAELDPTRFRELYDQARRGRARPAEAPTS